MKRVLQRSLRLATLFLTFSLMLQAAQFQEEGGVDLNVTVSSSPQAVVPGDVLTLHVSVDLSSVNIGQFIGSAPMAFAAGLQSPVSGDILVVVALPAGVTLLEASTDAGSCALESPNVLVCNVGNALDYYGLPLAVNLTIILQVDEGLQQASLAISASVQIVDADSLEIFDANPADNSATILITVIQLGADLSVALRDDGDPVLVGDLLTWTVTLTNEGPSAALQIVVRDILPDRITLVSVTGSAAAKALPRTGGAPAALSPQATEPAMAQALALQSVGALDCNVESTFVGGEVAAPILPSQDPSELGRSGSRAVVCTVASLQPGASLALDIAVQPQLAGTLLNSVSVESASGDPNPVNNVAQESTAVNAPALSASPQCVAPGSALTLVGLFALSLEPDAVRINGVPAKIQAFTPTGVIVEVPVLPSGPAQVTVQGFESAVTVTVDANCTIRPLTSQDVEAGFVIGDVLVFFKPGVSSAQIQEILRALGFGSSVEYPVLGFVKAVLDSPSLEATLAAVDQLNQNPNVDRAFLNLLLGALQADPQLLQQDWLLSLGLPAGWDLYFPKRGQGITIAVIDSGTDLSLAETSEAELTLNPAAPEGLNFAPVSPEQKIPLGQDDLGHGTAVTTIAAAASDNGFNGAGVAPQANVIVMKVFAVVNGQLKGTNEGIAQALENAFSLGVDVVNMSLGCSGCSASSEEQYRQYYNRVINNLLQKTPIDQAPVIVAASGNDGEHLVDSPAAHPYVIAVGSVKADLSTRSDFSNYGPELDFIAVGENNFTTLVDGVFASPGLGTSFAAPQVAGLAALILAEDPGLTADQVQNKIRQCFVEDLGSSGFDDETGWGRIAIPEQAKAGC